MWARIFRTSSNCMKEKQKIKQPYKSVTSVNQEYLCAVRTKSFADLFLQVQVLQVNDNRTLISSEFLLNPGQETITSILNSSSLFSKNNKSSHVLKSLLFDYFQISADASSFCSQLLKSLNHLQSYYNIIHQLTYNAIGNEHDRREYYNNYSSSVDQFGSVFSDLRSCVVLINSSPKFSNLNNKQEFKNIHEKHFSVLQQLKFNRKRVARKIKMVKCFNTASRVCATAACGLVAGAALFLAAHTLTLLLVGPAVFGLPLKPLKRKIRNLRFFKCGFLRKLVDQLDVAAKGAYILNRDFDTISRLVGRLRDEIEHNKTMIELCLERREDRLSFQVLKEIKKYELGFKKQVEELEEHVYLCLVTINRARAMVVKEISKACAENSVR
ncbi:hypothetical protein ACP275_13G042200 [Erythranthe tilingii]